MDSYDKLSSNHVEVGILTEPCNKYKPGKCTFYVQALNPMNQKKNQITKQTPSTSNIINKEPLTANKIEVGSNILIEMPKEVARNYPTKFIPPGTRFLISFLGGDINKPIVIGRDYDGGNNGSNK